MISHLYNLTYDTNKLIYEIETDSQTERPALCHLVLEAEQGWAWLVLGSENRLVVAKGMVEARGMSGCWG